MIEIDPNDHIERVAHKHWFLVLRDIVVLIFLVAIPVLIFAVSQWVRVDLAFTFDGATLYAKLFLLFSWLLVVWMIGWNMWTNYYLDALIITDNRIFVIEQHGLVSRTSSSFRLDRIQNIIVERKGVFETFLDFGTIELETAGEGENTRIRYLPHPYTVKKFINDMQDSALRRSQLVHTEPQTMGNTTPDATDQGAPRGRDGVS